VSEVQILSPRPFSLLYGAARAAAGVACSPFAIFDLP
jgi:hypothetical protein